MSLDVALSVSERLLRFTNVDSNRFVNLSDALLKFVDYLDKRRLCDIPWGYKRVYVTIIPRILTLRESGNEIDVTDRDEVWFSTFERDPQVLSALSQFFSDNGLSG